MNQSPYKVLNLQDDSSFEQIKERYLHLSRNLHPDKQPLQNYSMAKQHFEQIDKAYKSICSPLRRFIFRQYGLPGIQLIDQYPQQFYEFQNHRQQDQFLHVDLNDPQVQKKIRQLIEYMLHQNHAMHEVDKSKLSTRTVINVSKLLKTSILYKDSIRVPDLQKNIFSYQMPLPQFYGISNSFGLSHQSSGFARSASTDLGFNISSMIRVRNTFLLHGQIQINKNQSSFDFHIDKIIGTSLQLKFNPISINSDGQIGMPKCGFDKSFQKYSISGITDFYHLNLQIGDNQKQSKLSKSAKLMIEKNAIMLVPKLQYDVTDSLKLICQTNITITKQKDQLRLGFGLGYGYKLKINEEIKIQMMSFFGNQSYLQITFFSPKFKVSIPIVSEGNQYLIQSYKVSAMLGTYFLFQFYGFMMRRRQMVKKKMLQRQYNRLTQEKQMISKLTDYSYVRANQSLQKQLKYNGLVIVKAFIGSKQKVSKILNISKKIKVKEGTNQELFQEIKDQINAKIASTGIKYNQIQNQLYEITQIMREKVLGAQLINGRLQNLKICVYGSEKPHIIIVYLERGKLKTYQQKASKYINIGGLNKPKMSFLRKLQLWGSSLW